jgi:hypothetical protein
MSSRLLASLLTGTLLVSGIACAEHPIDDNWGPPAGYAEVTGRVTWDDVPVPNVGVMVTECGHPVDGFLGGALTDENGQYTIRGILPPVGFVGDIGDTAHTDCFIYVDRHRLLDTLVPLARTQVAVRPLQLNFIVRPGSAPPLPVP